MRTFNEIQSTHQLYCKLTGMELQFDMRRFHPWECFCSKFSDDDLRIVIKFLQDKQRMGKPSRSLTFRNLISGPESLTFFEEDLAEAKSRNRAARVDTNRASVLRSTFRPETPEKPARTAEQVMAGNAALSEFLKLKEIL